MSTGKVTAGTRARACMRRFYALVRRSHGEPEEAVRPAAVHRAPCSPPSTTDPTN
jgi:hypothetical protein